MRDPLKVVRQERFRGKNKGDRAMQVADAAQMLLQMVGTNGKKRGGGAGEAGLSLEKMRQRYRRGSEERSAAPAPTTERASRPAAVTK